MGNNYLMGNGLLIRLNKFLGILQNRSKYPVKISEHPDFLDNI